MMVGLAQETLTAPLRKGLGVGLTPVVAAALLAGCSFQGALDAMVEPERQAEIIRTAQAQCRAPRYRPACPTDANVVWQLANYHFNSSAMNGGPTERRESALVVAGDDDGPWTEVQLNFEQIGDVPPRLLNATVTRAATRPASLAFIDSYDSISWWGLGGTGVALTLLIAALLWVRKRRKAQGKGWTDA